MPSSLPPPSSEPEKFLEAVAQPRTTVTLEPTIDVEKQETGTSVKSTLSSDDSQKDSHIAHWDSEKDPQNPLNWSNTSKWTITILVSCGSFVTMMSGSMIAPALPQIARDFHISESEAQIELSIFILAFAFGPLFLAPFSEMYGRRPVWLISGTFYSIWSIVCGFSHSKGLMAAGRLLSGLGGSVDFVTAWPVLRDIWRAEERGKGFAIATFIPLLGPAIGPFLGGVMTQTIGWRWIFWVAASFNGLILVLCLLRFPETSHAIILKKKANARTKETGEQYHTEFEKLGEDLSTRLWTSLSRPTRMLLTSPILQLISIFSAYNFGILYFFLSTFAELYIEHYHEDTLKASLHYFALGIGYIIAAQFGGLALDRIWKRLTKNANGATAPEYRVPLLVPGGLLIPIGLLWYGWSAQAKMLWIMPDIGVLIYGIGTILSMEALGAYTLDTFGKHTASAVAASQFLRMIFGFVFPIFAPAMYHRLEWGWANTVLACIALVFGAAAPLLLWNYGAKIRAMGKELK